MEQLNRPFNKNNIWWVTPIDKLNKCDKYKYMVDDYLTLIRDAFYDQKQL